MIEYRPCIGGLVLIDMLLLLGVIPLLQLEVPRVCRWPSPPPLQYHKHDGAYHGDEVERQIHQVPDQGIGGELLKRRLRQFAQLSHDTTTALNLPAFRDQVCSILTNEYTIERVNQGIFNEEGFGEYCEERRRF